ncbi:hypothetical protein QVD17_15841 [Tagetes erecta]|uniref:Uncharacterized protein n=1 Tax=Tagetes erecta TaxID=13708 RepID=A0AAD8NZ13_TARER|nr:hypothetical protein QVD17_15841 [Tagetes erecta]
MWYLNNLFHVTMVEDSTMDLSSSSSDELDETRHRTFSYILSVVNIVLSSDVRDTAISLKSDIKRDTCGDSFDFLADYFSKSPKFNVRMFRERYQMAYNFYTITMRAVMVFTTC